MRCASLCLADGIQLVKLARTMRRKKVHTTLYHDALAVTLPPPAKYAYYFKNGCVVLWGCGRKQELELRDEVSEFLVRPLETIQVDHFSALLGNTTIIKPHKYFNADMMYVESFDEELLLALSFGLAKSVRLAEAEASVDNVIEENNDLVLEFTKHNTVRLFRRKLFRRMGTIFFKRSEINLRQDYLNAPEFFWAHPALESYYTQVENYMDIPRRFSVLNQKLDVLSDTFNMLTAQLQHQHSIILEIIIVGLILIEVISGFIHR